MNITGYRIKITFTKDELIQQIKEHCFLCWSIEEAVETNTGKVIRIESWEVIETIRKLVPHRFRKTNKNYYEDAETVECVLLNKYNLHRGTGQSRDKMIQNQINLIKAIPSNEITFDLMYRMLPRV